MKSFAVLLLAAHVAAQTNKVSGDADLAESPMAAYNNKDVTFSFGMIATSDAFLNGGAGVLDRVQFREALGAAFNTRSLAERAALVALLSAQEPNYNWDAFAAETYFTLSTVAGEAPGIYTNIVFDRVVEDTRSADATVSTADGTVLIDTNSWNVFLRITLRDIPEAIANNFEPVIMQAIANYGVATILTDSIWVDTTAYFINDQLAPVTGRGHKSQRLLIPLILGVACMLIVPIVISALAVASAKAANKGKVLVEAKEKEIVVLQRNAAVNDAFIQTFAEREEEHAQHEHEHKAHLQQRDEYELTEKDVDWKNA